MCPLPSLIKKFLDCDGWRVIAALLAAQGTPEHPGLRRLEGKNSTHSLSLVFRFSSKTRGSKLHEGRKDHGNLHRPSHSWFLACGWFGSVSRSVFVPPWFIHSLRNSQKSRSGARSDDARLDHVRKYGRSRSEEGAMRWVTTSRRHGLPFVDTRGGRSVLPNVRPTNGFSARVAFQPSGLRDR